MTAIVTVASGKGGVGKSVVVSNLGLALAAQGRRVILADLDVGGGNLATLFGAFEAGPDLDDFFTRKIDSLEGALRPLRKNLSLIVGAGETLATANPNWAMKQRLLRQLRKLDADFVLVDIGAGAGHHSLDFFCAGDIRVLVTLPEPTASVDGYRFLKLATVRESTTRISARNPERRRVERADHDSAQELWTKISNQAVEPPDLVAPWVILNQATDARRHFDRLRTVSRRFLESDLRLLGEIPRDDSVRMSVADYLPVLEGNPGAPASRSFREMAQRLEAESIRLSIAGLSTSGSESGRKLASPARSKGKTVSTRPPTASRRA